MIALFLDTETTGLDPTKDVLAEVGAVLVDCRGGAGRVLRTFTSLVHTGDAPFPEDVQRITHLSPDICNAHGVPLAAAVATLQRMAAGAECVVVWNAPFDRAFLEAAGFRAPLWVDAMRHIDWKALGASGLSQTMVLAEVGRAVNPCPHTVLGDVMGLVQLAMPWMDAAVERAKLPHVWVSVFHSPYGSNDALKDAGFRWRAEKRVHEAYMLATEADALRLPDGCRWWVTDDALPVVPFVDVGAFGVNREDNDRLKSFAAFRWSREVGGFVAEVRQDVAEDLCAAISEFCRAEVR